MNFDQFQWVGKSKSPIMMTLDDKLKRKEHTKEVKPSLFLFLACYTIITMKYFDTLSLYYWLVCRTPDSIWLETYSKISWNIEDAGSYSCKLTKTHDTSKSYMQRHNNCLIWVKERSIIFCLLCGSGRIHVFVRAQFGCKKLPDNFA